MSNPLANSRGLFLEWVNFIVTGIAGAPDGFGANDHTRISVIGDGTRDSQTTTADNLALEQLGEIPFSGLSGFSNSGPGRTGQPPGDDGSIYKSTDAISYRPEKVNRPGVRSPNGKTPTTRSRMLNLLDCIRSGRERHSSFKLDFRASTASRITVQTYRKCEICIRNRRQRTSRNCRNMIYLQFRPFKLNICKLLALVLLAATATPAADLHLGIIGTDTSHAVAFTRALNNPAAANHIPGARVVVAYKGGSPDVKESRSRVDGYASELRDKWGVHFVDTIPAMCSEVDGILLESLDGRTHLWQMKEAVTCGKPMFIDKPLASSLEDAKAIVRLAAEKHVPWFTASTLRFSDIQSLKRDSLNGAMVWGPGPTEPHQALDFSWYGIHAAEMLYTLMGPGCSVVTRVSSENADIVTCKWSDGRLGTLRVDRPYSKFGAVAFRSENRVDSLPDIKVDYIPLVREIVKFMATSKPPVDNAETLELFQFLDAAQRSKTQNGSPIEMHSSAD